MLRDRTPSVECGYLAFYLNISGVDLGDFFLDNDTITI